MWQCSFAGFFDKFRITKCGKVILLQSVTDCYYKVRQVLQSVTVVTKWDVTLLSDFRIFNAQNLNFSIKDFFSKCDQIRSFLLIWSNLLKKSLMEYLIFLYSDPSIQNFEKCSVKTICRVCLANDEQNSLALIFWDFENVTARLIQYNAKNLW